MIKPLKCQTLVYSKSKPCNTLNSIYCSPMVATFGDWLRIKINDAGLNVAEVARRAGMTRQNLGRIVNNAPHWQTGTLPRVKIETVDKIARAIGVDINEARLAAGYAPTNTKAARLVVRRGGSKNLLK